MSTEPTLNFDELLAPIPGDNPAGEPISFALRSELEEDRKEIDPNDFDANDPVRPAEPKKADWKDIITKAKEALKKESKDLLLGARLTEALTKTYRFAGLRDGLTLMRRMLDECWDRLHPTIEDGDLEVRAGPFNWLGDDGRGARFPYSVRTIPMFAREGVWYTLRDWKLVQTNKGTVRLADLEAAINASTREYCQQQADDIDGAITELGSLLATLNQRLTAAAPGMIDLRSALVEAQTLARQALQKKGAAPVAAPAEEQPAGNGATATASATPARAMVTRQDVYDRLKEAAHLLEQMEPHSPVPYLLRKCVMLGSLPFPQLMKVLIRDDFKQALEELNRELGISEEEAAAAAEASKAAVTASSSGW